MKYITLPYGEYLELINRKINADESLEEQLKEYEEISKSDLKIINKLRNIIYKIKQRVLDETKPLPSAKEIIDIIEKDQK